MYNENTNLSGEYNEITNLGGECSENTNSSGENFAENNKSVELELSDADKAIQTLKMEKISLKDDIQQLKDALNTKENDKQLLTNQLAESEYNGKAIDSKLKSQLEQVLILKKENDDLKKINDNMSEKISFLKIKLNN